MKIIDIVKLNDGYAFVLDESPTMVYHEEMVKDKYTGKMKRMLVGQNEAGMMDFLTYGNELPYAKAFAGREFEILMEDGSKRTLKDVMADYGEHYGCEWEFSSETVNKTINNIPSEKVKPIVYARWVKIFEDGEPASTQQQIGVCCSKCMKIPEDKFTESNFCPNCGADMRGNKSE